MFSGAMSPVHWLLVLVVLLVLFGAKRLPEAARGLGRSARVLKAELNEMRDDEAKPGQASGEAKAPSESTASSETKARPALD
jgi:sec-independent protein translocase protein TatA